MSKVEVAVDGPVRNVTLNRPEQRNALDADMLDGLIEAFPKNPGKDERVAVLRANGTVFSAGADLKQRKEKLGQPTDIETALRAVETFPLPVVAVVQGPAIAGGNELALHCDFVLASTEAIFGMSLSQIGLAPTWFLTKKLMEVAGPVTTREILLLGEPLPATRMHELGVIFRVAPPERLEEEAKAVIGRLAANAPLSLKVMKAMMLRQMAFRDHVEHAELNSEVARISGSADAREGIEARLARRQPIFRGE